MPSSSTRQPYGSAQTPQQGPSDLSPKPPVDRLELNGSLTRKRSFSFLRRSKSRGRAVSAGNATPRKLSRKGSKKMQQEEMRKLREDIGERPPRIPAVPSQPEIKTFGGHDRRPDSAAMMSDRGAGTYPQPLARKSPEENVRSAYYPGMPVPPVPPLPPIPGDFESMVNRGRYSYASSAISTINSPRKIRRRKDPTPFNILVLGSTGSGKTSFVNFLQSSMALPLHKRRQSARDEFEDPPPASEASFPNFSSTFVETEIGGERIGVTLWDSEGLQKHVIDNQLKELSAFIESKFEDTFTEESKVARAPGFRDTHIHCVFMLLDPQRLDANIAADRKAKVVNGAKAKANSFAKNRPEPTPAALDEYMDLSVLRTLKDKTTVVPVISKADIITGAHMEYLKRAVWESLKRSGIDSVDALAKDGDDALSDTSTERDFDERYEDAHDHDDAKAGKNVKDLAVRAVQVDQGDKFSATSHLDSPSSSDSFPSADFNLPKPAKPKDDDSASSTSSRAPALPQQQQLPFSTISPDPYEPEVIGRRFPWGFADPHNLEHCDFTKLRTLVFSEWRPELREASRELWYEGWRTNRLNKKNKRNAMSLEGNVMQTKTWTGQGNPRAHHNQPWVQ